MALSPRFWQPPCDRDGLEVVANGQPDGPRAKQRWQDLLAEHEDPPMDAMTKRQLRHIWSVDVGVRVNSNRIIKIMRLLW